MKLSDNRDGADPQELYDERRKDHISHFVLRLAFCRSEEQRRWLLQQETELFRWVCCLCALCLIVAVSVVPVLVDGVRNYTPFA